MRTRILTLGLLTIVAAGTLSTAQQAGNPLSQGRTDATLGARVRADYGKLPLTFEANQGQTDPRVKFMSRGPGYKAFLTSDGMVLSLRAQQAVPNHALNAVPSSPGRRTTLQFRLLGAAKHPAVVGEVPQVGRINYFLGDNPAKWKRNVPTYAQVRYKDIYPGIDLVYYGNHQQLEFDFAVAPKGDPRKIQFEISGANHLSITADGTLVLTTGSGQLHFQPPVVYQESNGQRVAVNGGYAVKDSTHVSFQVADYDRNKPLVIDPVLMYATYLGGSGDDQPSGIAVDTAGNLYLGGSTDSADFPLTTLGSLPAGETHAFVAKFDATGSNLIYADYLGGNSQEYGAAVAIDAASNVYLTGSTASSDFPMAHPFQGTYPGSYNGFLSKISADGSSLLYSTYFGGNGSDLPSSLAVDSIGNMILAGYTSSTNLPVANAYQSTVSPNGGGMYGNYGFLTKFSPDGSSLVYSTYFGGSSNVPLDCGGTPCWPQPVSSIDGMAIDGLGNAYLTGATNTYNFPVTQGAYLTTNSAPQYSSVGFVSKFNGNGSLQYSSYFYEASGSLTKTTAIAVDGSGSAYVTGVALSDGTFPATSSGICNAVVLGSGCNYAFVTKFDAVGATLLYSTFLGPNNNASPQAIALDGNNDAYILASVGSGLFSAVNGLENYGGANDMLLVEIDPAASTQLFATYLGGSGNDQPLPGGIAVDAQGNIYVAGQTDSANFPVTQSAFQKVFGGATDAVIVKIGPGVEAASLSANSLQYASQAVGTSSQPKTVTLSSVGSLALSISSIATTGNFRESDNCGSSVPAGSSCTLSITFRPAAAGSLTGSVVIQDGASGSPHVISLSGSASDFSISSSAPSATIKAGATATYNLTISGLGGAFANAIQLSCSGAPQNSTCSVSPGSVTPGSNSASAVLTVNTTATSAALAAPSPAGNQPVYAVWMQLQGLGVVGIVLAGSRRRTKKLPVLIVLALLVGAMLLMTACAGGTGISQQRGTPPGTSTITVSGTSGSLQHSVPLTLTVQ